MALEIWEQEEWHGIVRRGVSRKDPFTSQLEVNTQPGEDELKRITARQPYMGQLPAPAAYFIDPCTHYCGYWDFSGVKKIKHSAVVGIRSIACFKPPDPTEAMSPTPIVFCAADSPASADLEWVFRLAKTATADWLLETETRITNSATLVNTSDALSPSSWYWADLLKDEVGQTCTLTVYKDGSTTPLSTHALDISPSPENLAGSYTARLAVGAYSNHTHTFVNGHIAHAAFGGDTAAWATPWVTSWAPFYVAPVATATHTFTPIDAGYVAQPCGFDDGYRPTWIRFPRPGIQTSVGSSPFVGTGLDSRSGKSYMVDLSDKTLMEGLTVFMLLAKWEGQVDLLRSYDGQFRVGTELLNAGGDNRLSVLWPCDSCTAGDVTWGRRREELSSADGLTAGSAYWLAVQCDPDISGTAANCRLFHWNVAGNTWDMIAGTASFGGGWNYVDMTKLVLLETCGPRAELYDFRVVQGDDNWTTTYTATSQTTSLPKELLAWLNHDASGRFPRDDHCDTRVLEDDANLYQRTIALSDRVDGQYRYTPESTKPRVGWSGCPHLLHSPLPRVHDMLPNAEGTVSGVTDFYYFDGTTATPSIQTDVKGRRQYAKVGELRYVVGPGPLQVCRSEPKTVGMPRLFIRCRAKDENETTATKDWKGHLGWSTSYKVMTTVYDPQTGSESNPYGPWTIITGSAPGGTTAPPSQDPGCGFDLEATIYSAKNLAGQQLRFYRFHSGTGLYHYEGMATISEGSYDTTRYWTTYEAGFRLMLKGTKLLQRMDLQYNNDDPPTHTQSYIWGGRAWYVDAVNPTRVWFSKTNDFGSVPGSYMLWTDEGLGGDILGMLPGFGGLLLLRERSIWIIPQFINPSQAIAQPLIPDIGCTSGSCAVFAEGVLWWAAPSGIYSYDGTQVVNHSERLKGLDRKVWDHAPRLTYAYYDRFNWRVTFTCDGSGIAVDIRSGAASLTAAPESCVTDVSSSAYSGILFGGDGTIFQETTGNAGLTLDTATTMCSDNAGPLVASTATAFSFYWLEELDDTAATRRGTAAAGWGFALATPTAYDFLSTATVIGRCVTLQSTDKLALWAHAIQATPYKDTTKGYCCIVRTRQPLLDNYYIDRNPFYYESQDLFLGPRRDARVYELLDMITGETTATATADVALYSKMPGQATELVATARGLLTHETDFQLPARIRGNQCRYVIESSAPSDLPEIKSVRVHFEQMRPRSANRR